MASLPPADWQGLNLDLLHISLLHLSLRWECRDIVRAASTCKRWRAVLTPRFWKELCIQQQPSTAMLSTATDFFAYAKAQHRQNRYELLLPGRWKRPEVDINGIVLLLEGELGRGPVNLALPFADAIYGEGPPIDVRGPVPGATPQYTWTVPAIEIDYHHFVYGDEDGLRMRLFRPESTSFALTDSTWSSSWVSDKVPPVTYDTAWRLHLHPAAEFYATGTPDAIGTLTYYELRIRIIPSNSTGNSTIVCSVEPPRAFSDDARRDQSEYRHLSKVLGMLEWT